MTTEKSPCPIVAESANTTSLRSELFQSLKTSEEYRHAFVEEKVRTGLAAQIAAIRKAQEMDPIQFAEKLGKKVSWIYRLEDPNAPAPTIPSLLEVARALDIDLDVRFRPFSKLIDDLDSLSSSSFRVPSFNQELLALEREVLRTERLNGKHPPISESVPQQTGVGTYSSIFKAPEDYLTRRINFGELRPVSSNPSLSSQEMNQVVDIGLYKQAVHVFSSPSDQKPLLSPITSESGLQVLPFLNPQNVGRSNRGKKSHGRSYGRHPKTGT